MKFSVQMACRLPVSTCLTKLATAFVADQSATSSLPRSERDMLRRDVDAHSVRESALPEVREQPARAAADLKNGRRAVEVIQKRQVFVVPPDSRWLRCEFWRALEGGHIPVVQRRAPVRRHLCVGANVA